LKLFQYNAALFGKASFVGLVLQLYIFRNFKQRVAKPETRQNLPLYVQGVSLSRVSSNGLFWLT